MTKRGGWDNEPEYGGPEPSWREAAIIVFVILAIAALVLLALNWRHPLRLAGEGADPWPAPSALF
jgi:hypothetical protein